MMRVLIAAVVGFAFVSAQTCDNAVFSDAAAWGVDPRLSSLLNLSGLPASPVPYDASQHTVCSYFDGQDVCCHDATLTAIEVSLNTTKYAMAAAQASINNEDMFAELSQMLSMLSFNSTIAGDLHDLQAAVQSLQASQIQCVQSLVAYTEGMMCFACSANASQYVDAASKVFRLSEDTCTGVVAACSPVFSATKTIFKVVMTIVSRFFPVDDTEVAGMPDMCGGTEAAPGNCTEFICSNWLQGVRIPDYEWDIEGFNASAAYLSRSLSPAVFGKAVVAMLQRKHAAVARLHQLAASVSNVYVANGYPALAVGCSDTNCGPAQGSQPESGSHTVAIAVGCSVGGVAVVLLAVLAVRRRSSRAAYAEGGMLMEGQKTYSTV